MQEYFDVKRWGKQRFGQGWREWNRDTCHSIMSRHPEEGNDGGKNHRGF
jgi:hypothetical protein